MQVHMHISPDIPDGAPFAHMNPGNGEPFGVISFDGGTYFSVKDDAEAERVMEVAQQLIAMRQMIGIPHAFKSAGPGLVASIYHCTECGMLDDWADHAAPVSAEAAVLAGPVASGKPLLVANPPHHATGGEQACKAPGWDDSADSGYVCTAQDGHDGPDHIAYKPFGGEYHRWPVAPEQADHPFDAGEGSRELAGPGRELLREAIAEQDAADEAAEPVCQWHGGEGPSGTQCGACRDEAAVRQSDSLLLNETKTTAAGAL